jgi:hypothetical protein
MLFPNTPAKASLCTNDVLADALSAQDAWASEPSAPKHPATSPKCSTATPLPSLPVTPSPVQFHPASSSPVYNTPVSPFRTYRPTDDSNLFRPAYTPYYTPADEFGPFQPSDLVCTDSCADVVSFPPSLLQSGTVAPEDDEFGPFQSASVEPVSADEDDDESDSLLKKEGGDEVVSKARAWLKRRGAWYGLGLWRLRR